MHQCRLQLELFAAASSSSQRDDLTFTKSSLYQRLSFNVYIPTRTAETPPKPPAMNALIEFAVLLEAVEVVDSADFASSALFRRTKSDEDRYNRLIY